VSLVRVWFSVHGAEEGKPWTLMFDGSRVNCSSVVFLGPTRTCFSRDPKSRATLPEGWIEAVGTVFMDPTTHAAEVRP
jgi:hypothetical protein